MRNTDLTPSQAAELEALAAMPDEDIDTSDIPEITEFSNPRRGVFAGSPNVKLETKSQLITRFKQRDYEVLIIRETDHPGSSAPNSAVPAKATTRKKPWR